MKVVEENLKGNEGEIKLIPETIEDLWHLKYIVEPGDIVFSLTKRVSESSDKLRSDKEMVVVRLGIQVEKVEFHKFANRLRITGRIVGGIDESGYHTINITMGKELSVIKKWKEEQIERIKTAVESSNRPEVVIVTIEEGEAVIGVLRQWGVEEVGVVRGSYGKDRGDYRREFFGEVYSALKNLDFRYLVIAGPGFAKNDFYEFLKEKEKIDAVIVDTSSIGTRGFVEVLKRGVIDRIVGEIKIAKDAKYIDKLLEEIAKDGKAAYSLDEVRRAFEYGAIETLLITDEFLRKEREKWDIDEFLKNVENMGAKIVIMSSEFEPGKRLNALGGIAALLRFKF
uniref:Protein pelota homolog n=1 Tax=Geoglobus ahangari TaxID=113653 RepID=A0A7C3UKW6_9EURY